ncbi:guanylate kinase [Tepiditoga spiralis]|uniref:Guanylate kinase n=1 Tax=Tepiditoga spiralis TaxID=2108365 RepID=A0A7G1G1E6_9BACT|nr:guanylate kinase [Tepiditoga spiralis]BBE30091.1 guanylate kinase [Tepiditoga spiralis]
MKGILYVVSGPSGAGKSSMIKKALNVVDGFTFSVSYTTRAMRPGEKDGIDYNFISEEQFKKMEKNNEFLECAEVHGYYYGTGKEEIKNKLAEGYNIVLDVDVQGALNIKKVMADDTVLIFIAPPSYEELRRRLEGRGTENHKDLTKRLEDAHWELSKIYDFDYLIVNQNLNESINQLISIIIAEQLNINRIGQHLGKYKFFKQTFNER